jgi:hypothetical protein
VETLLSLPPPTSCASCSWFFRATPKGSRMTRFFSRDIRLVGRSIDPAAKPKPLGAASITRLRLAVSHTAIDARDRGGQRLAHYR